MMVDINLLQQFLEVATAGTLSEAAEYLHISQPALSKAMKKLENELEVPLFTRRKNRMGLNDNGRYFKNKVIEFLKYQETMVQDLKDFDRVHRNIHIGVSAPIMIRLIGDFVQNHFPENSVTVDLVSSDQMLVEGLNNGVYHLIVTHHQFSGLYSKVCGDEQLYIRLPRLHPLASKEDVTFDEIDGLTMLRMMDVGFWGDVVESHMPHTKFLLQGERDMFVDLVESSTLPSFTTDYFLEANESTEKVVIPISDDDAYATYYLCCRKNDRQYYRALFAQVSINTFKDVLFQSLNDL